jgi:DNA polymerase-3 subunit epsilon
MGAAVSDWHRGELFLFDLETTGKEVEDDEPVTAALVFINPGGRESSLHLTLNPGRDIHPEATRIHGITTEYARKHGWPLAEALERICTELTTAINCRVPVVGMNLAFDFTILDRSCRRHAVPTLTDRVGTIAPVIDVMVLDNKVRPRRELWERRKLVNLCQYYKVKHDGAHDAIEDAKAAARVAYKLAAQYVQLRVDPMELHAQQVIWRRQQDEKLAAMFAKLGRPFTSQPHWPLIPFVPHDVQADVLDALREHFTVDLLGDVERSS